MRRELHARSCLRECLHFFHPQEQTAAFAIAIARFGQATPVYSVKFAHNQNKKQAAPKTDMKETEKTLLMGEGKGLALPPPNAPGIAQPDRVPAKPEPLIVMRDKKRKPDAYQREMEKHPTHEGPVRASRRKEILHSNKTRF